MRPATAPDDPNRFRTDLRELRFLLWEVLEVQRWPGELPLEAGSREICDRILEDARDFAFELGRHYRSGDAEGCTLRPDGSVRIPAAFPGLWARLVRDWVGLRAGSGPPAAGPPERPSMHPFSQVVLEMFMGANPAFMTYGGFSTLGASLLRLAGTPAQCAAWQDKLERYEWDACFCTTEPQAGSDLTGVRTWAEEQGDGVYRLYGEKLYITAGLHGLTANTLYFVLGRSPGRRQEGFSLSCFVVPRWWTDERSGARLDNHVECVELAGKMGFRGCPNTRLRFGARGPTRAYLLGERHHVGLLQLRPLMSQARIGTALFAVGLAARAYLSSVAYSRKRVQGRPLSSSAAFNVARVPIGEHADVQRMLLDMKVRVEGCRGLVARISRYSSLAAAAERAGDAPAGERGRALERLLTPIAKAFASDQAWRVCETAIQVHGGLGYTDRADVEQCARDAKILSIWEGTNFIQATDLLRDRLGYGESKALGLLAADLEAFLAAPRPAGLDDDYGAALAEAWRAAVGSLRHAAEAVAQDRLEPASQFFTRQLEMFGLVLAGWSLLEAAQVAARRLGAELPEAERAFYTGKLKAARYFFRNLLPSVHLLAALVADPQAYVSVSHAELGEGQGAEVAASVPPIAELVPVAGA